MITSGNLDPFDPFQSEQPYYTPDFYSEALATSMARTVIDLPRDRQLAVITDLYIEQQALRARTARLEEVGTRQEDELNTDTLTGLANARRIRQVLDSSIASAPGTVAAAFVDLDHMKEVNDTRGHAAGDEHLQEAATVLAAETLKGSVRTHGRPPHELDEVGLAAHLHGDEFVVAFRGVRSEALAAIQERLRVRLDEAGIEASIGIKMHTNGETTDDLLDGADRLMYVQKQAHRLKRMESNQDTSFL